MITEELNGNGRDCDISALYQRRFRVFIEPKKYLKARNEAILYVVAAAIEKTLETCFRCGHTLEYKNIKDKDERELYPFLPVVSKNANDFGSSSANICLECALRDYQKDQKAIDDVIVDPDDDGTAARWDEIKTAEKNYLQAKEKAKENAMNKSRADYELNEFNTFVNDEEGDLAVSDEETELVAIMAVPIKPEVAIFSTDEVDKLAKAYADAPRDQAARVKSIVKKIRNGSPIKQLATIPDNWRDYCDDLAKRFPNFSEPVLYIRNQFALAAASDRVFRLSPFILNGPPGCGKSFFALALASDLKSVLQVIDISSSQTGSPLTGSELYWANSQPGILFNTIVLGDIANPIFMLDEVDKAYGRRGEYDPLSALHQLLEPKQAKNFHDLCVPELTIDASHVVFIATSNSIEGLEGPIVDRFTVFNIEEPSIKEMPAIVTNQYLLFLDKHPSGGLFKRDIGEDVLKELCGYHPRKVRKILELAFGLAAYSERDYLTVDDVKAGDVGDKEKPGIGFMSVIEPA
jgi:MoxR-like ATPase